MSRLSASTRSPRGRLPALFVSGPAEHTVGNVASDNEGFERVAAMRQVRYVGLVLGVLSVAMIPPSAVAQRGERGESSAQVRERVERARAHQRKRFSNQRDLFANADMRTGDIQKFCVLTDDARQVLELSVRRMQLSARAYHRVLKVARTLADLDASDGVKRIHLAEAIAYRMAGERLAQAA